MHLAEFLKIHPHLSLCQNLLPFKDEWYPIVYIYTAFCLSICQWTLELLPPFGYCGKCCYVHACAANSLRPCFHFFWGTYPDVGLLDHMVIPCLIFFEKMPHCSPQWLYHFIFQPTVHMGSNFSASLPTLVIFCCFCFCFDGSHLKGCEVASRCGFDLHFLEDP